MNGMLKFIVLSSVLIVPGRDPVSPVIIYRVTLMPGWSGIMHVGANWDIKLNSVPYFGMCIDEGVYVLTSKNTLFSYCQLIE